MQPFSQGLAALNTLFASEGHSSTQIAVTQNEDLAFKLLLGMPVPMLVARLADREVLYRNDHFDQVFGVVQTKTYLDMYFNPSAWQVIQQALLQCHFLSNYELELRRPDGDSLCAVVSLQLLQHQGEDLVLGTFLDTTYPRAIEQALQANQRRLVAITNHLPGLIYRLCLTTQRLEFMSEGGEGLTGYRTRDFTHDRSITLRDLIHPEDRVQVQRMLEAALEQQVSYRMDYRMVTRTGEQKWVCDQGYGVVTPQGNVAIEGLITEITDQKRAEEERQLLQELSQMIGEAADLETALQGVLARVCETTGWALGEVWCPGPSGQVLELHPAWYRSASLRHAQEFRIYSGDFRFARGVGLPGRVWQLEKPQWFPDVSLDPTFVRSQLALRCGLRSGFGVPIIAEGTVVAVLVFFTMEARLRDPRLLDLINAIATQLSGMIRRKQAIDDALHSQLALQESQRQLTSLIDALPGVFFRASAQVDWPMLYLSEGCYGITGYTSAELIASGFHSFNELIHPDDRTRILQAIRRALAQRKRYNLEYRIITKTGEERWVWERGHGVYDEAGELGMIEGLITDINDRHQMERALRNSETEQRVLMSAMSDVICVFDRQGRCLRSQIPPTLTPFFAPLGTPPTAPVATLLNAPQIAAHQAAIAFVLTHQTPQVDLELTLSHAGQNRWFAANISPLDCDRVIWVARDITLWKAAEAERQTHLGELEALFAAMTDLILVLSADGTYLKIAPTNTALLYRPADVLLGQSITDIFPPDLAALFLRTIDQVLATGETLHDLEYCLNMGDRSIWFVATVSPTREHTVVWVARDITTTKLAQQALAEAEQNYRSIFENALEGIFQTSPDGIYLSANPALARIYGYPSPMELISSLTDIGHQLYVDPQQREEFQDVMQKQGVVIGFESQVYRKDGTVIWISENARAVRDERGNILRYEGMVMDITNQKAVEAELHRRAFYDPLTQLPNRALFQLRLNEAIARSQTSAADVDSELYHFAVLFLDLDRFKVVNDSLGHLVGDQLLIAIARRIEDCLRTDDIVARLGGDEFTILLDAIEDINTATRIAERIETALRAPFDLNGYQVFTGASIGIVLSGNLNVSETEWEGQTAEELLRDADTALYQAKARGKGRYELFTPTMHDKAMSQMKLETELRQAIEAQLFQLHYQPIINLKTGMIQGLDALLYWHHPQQGLIPALEHWQQVEETGQWLAMTHWMISTVCEHLQQWELTTDIFVHIHCSARQYGHPEFLKQLDTICAQTQVKPSQLRLAVTDGFWEHQTAGWHEQLTALRDRNIRLCITEFGTSHTSLHRLQQSPIQSFKLDPVLIQELGDPGETRETLRILIILAHQFHLDVIASHVTTAQQVEILRELNCDFVHGPLFAETFDAVAMKHLLHQSPPLML
ncbi:PAS domain-containing protein [Spirulina major]|uniref:PAS domain-containing protein n=1 Tax=Spirulina major TaxID=270636 RepID=UPI00093256FF|nr:PAS domain-containing protein [Spirulina major]